MVGSASNVTVSARNPPAPPCVIVLLLSAATNSVPAPADAVEVDARPAGRSERGIVDAEEQVAGRAAASAASNALPTEEMLFVPVMRQVSEPAPSTLTSSRRSRDALPIVRFSMVDRAVSRRRRDFDAVGEAVVTVRSVIVGGRSRSSTVRVRRSIQAERIERRASAS